MPHIFIAASAILITHLHRKDNTGWTADSNNAQKDADVLFDAVKGYCGAYILYINLLMIAALLPFF